MIAKLWNAFKAWHNKPHVTMHQMQAALHDEGFKVVKQPKKPKPHIKLMRYSKGGTKVYGVEPNHADYAYDNEFRKSVANAAYFCRKLNKKEGRL